METVDVEVLNSDDFWDAIPCSQADVNGNVVAEDSKGS
jgi:hypothetical protein